MKPVGKEDNDGFGLWEWAFVIAGLVLFAAFLIMSVMSVMSKK